MATQAQKDKKIAAAGKLISATEAKIVKLEAKRNSLMKQADTARGPVEAQLKTLARHRAHLAWVQSMPVSDGGEADTDNTTFAEAEASAQDE